MIEGGLGDLQAIRDVVHGGAAVTAFEEQLYGAAENGVALPIGIPRRSAKAFNCDAGNSGSLAIAPRISRQGGRQAAPDILPSGKISTQGGRKSALQRPNTGIELPAARTPFE